MRTLVFLLAASASAVFAQTAPLDTQPLQSLVNEIRQLRIDMQATTITTQRVQIVLYRLQSQTGLVTRAASHLEDLRSSLANVQSEKKNLSGRLQQVEDALHATQNPMERKGLEDVLPQVKAGVERFAADEQRLQSRLIDAETQHRSEQAKLADLESQLDRLDKVLDSFTRK